MVSDMEAGFRLRDARIAIVGLGLMGGSLALALKGKCAAIYGVDFDHATLELALTKGVVDQTASEPIKLLSQADLIILATPVPAILDFIRKLPALAQNDCIVLDLGSTKENIVQAMASLPERFDPIGGHPICGKEKLGLENAEANLYQGASFVITPLGRTTLRARQAAVEIITAVGSHLIEMKAEEHDRALAFTSHLPFLLSSALALCTPAEYAPFIGTGFRSTSRLAGTPSSITLGILQSNRENVLMALSVFQSRLAEIQAGLVAADFQALEGIFNHSRSAYHSLVSNLYSLISTLYYLLSNPSPCKSHRSPDP
jgi:prephenate dehydrogenase